jgi:predicted  nucleic acid-binding Zn-ribbon protein
MENNELLKLILETVTGLKDDVTDLKNDVTVLKDDVTEIKNRVTKIETTLENKTDKHIELLVESHSNLVKKAEKLDIIAEDVQDIKMTVNVLEAVTQKNSYDINK